MTISISHKCYLPSTSILPLRFLSLWRLRHPWPLYLLSYSIVSLLGSAFLHYPCNDLVTSYLSSRKSAVSIPPHLSPSEPLIFGVPQGSVLGSIPFNLYTTPLSTPLVSLSSHTSFMQTILKSSSLSFPKKLSHCYFRLRIYYISHIFLNVI